jgi:hypothetical protein
MTHTRNVAGIGRKYDGNIRENISCACCRLVYHVCVDPCRRNGVAKGLQLTPLYRRVGQSAEQVETGIAK